MALDFLPIQDGQIITAANWNELIAAIQTGTIFSAGNVVGETVTALNDRLVIAEARIEQLQAVLATQQKRKQFVLEAGQSVINLADAPTIDGELLFLNGLLLAKNDLSPAMSHDYTISGSVVTLDPALAVQVADGDLLVAAYQYVVGA